MAESMLHRIWNTACFYVCFSVVFVRIKVVRLRWFVLEDYYRRLTVQAQFLYRQTPLFKERWQLMGLDYAEKSFEGDAELFFFQAQKSHWRIRMRINLNSLE